MVHLAATFACTVKLLLTVAAINGWPAIAIAPAVNAANTNRDFFMLLPPLKI
jgi:hypothetical protein